MIMFTDYKSYKQYFQLIAAAHPDVQGFVMYDAMQRIAAQRSVTPYPVMELERPAYRAQVIEGGNHLKTYTCRLSLLDYAEKDDWKRQEDVLNDLEAGMDEIIKRLIYDGVIEEDPNNVYPIRNFEHDNLWGWGIEFEVTFSSSYCYTGVGWQEAVLLEAIWTPGETLLAVAVDGVTYSLPWTDEQAAPPIEALASLIAAAGAPDLGAVRQEGFLLIRALTDGYPLDVNESIAGHEWNLVTLPE